MITSTREPAFQGGRDHRNPRPASIGTGGRLRSESPADFVGMRNRLPVEDVGLIVGTAVAGQVTHFEIYGEEPAKLAEFYSSLFGWKLEKAPGIDYWRIWTPPGDSKGFGGGLTYRASQGPHCWIHYVMVDSVDGVLAEAERLGARVLRPKTAVPKAGWYATLADPQGNPFAIWQADPTAFPPPEPE
jgi:uncharacterized protein